MKRNFDIGDEFILSENALENYGEKFRGKIFVVREWFDHVGTDTHGHLGFDTGASSCLYEADGMGFAVYEWEIISV